ncbi:MAG: hypothetical protein NZ523_09265 [Elioraea sp.]|nr:hypothetical protein [Elioraea sp.]MDW8445109.1 hypothetical protein [Acetobacteraceae bacterium]
MSERHYLVLTAAGRAQQRVVGSIRAGGGVVLLAVPSGAIVARMGEALKEAIAALPGVRHLGGVDVAPRPPKRIRVRADGRPGPS